MTQHTPTIGANQSGLDYRTQDNDGKKALLNHHKGSSAPSYAEAGIIWLDDAATPWVLKVYDGTDWIKLGDINATTNSFFPYEGTATPRLLNHAADTGASNAYAMAPVPAITAYATGQIVLLSPANASTGACTLAVNGLTAKNIKLMSGSDPASGALMTTGVYQLVYDGTNFVLLNPAQSIDLPAGSVMPYAGTSEPSGWLFCYGQAISRATYAALFSAIGTAYGAGDGSTTFNIPDLRGRVVAGQDDMGGTSANRLTNQSGGVDGDVLGATGGAETHTLTIAQMPAHTHDIIFNNNSFSSSNKPVGGLNTSTTGATSSTGGDGAHNNVQPTIILNYIIKT